VNQGSDNYEAGVEIFDQDEKGYVRWLQENPKGYFLNCYRNSKPAWRLHRVNCYTFAGRTNLTTGQYFKVCSTDHRKLLAWAETRSDPEFGPCKACSPLAP
jgi:hypothetical protein